MAFTFAHDALGDAPKTVLALHGGCGVMTRAEMTPAMEKEYRAALDAALVAGKAALDKEGGTALDAVIAAVIVMEDSPLFNAGKGAAFSRDGRNELDAAIMDGSTGRAGAVAGVTTVKNPITAARAVMEKSGHVLLAGPGADAFAKSAGCQIVDPSYFRTEYRWRAYQERLRKEKDADGKSSSIDRKSLPGAERFGTVGAVALDRHGNLAAATSTGGLTMKRHGRIGDSPIIGAGTFARNESCAVSATGDGEYFIRGVAAHDVAARVEYKKQSVADAARDALANRITKAGGEGAFIVLDRTGALAMPFNTEGMYRGYVTSDGKRHVAIYQD
jgi:beta-aspartyl-peptidase (threonine type)